MYPTFLTAGTFPLTAGGIFADAELWKRRRGKESVVEYRGKQREGETNLVNDEYTDLCTGKFILFVRMMQWFTQALRDIGHLKQLTELRASIESRLENEAKNRVESALGTRMHSECIALHWQHLSAVCKQSEADVTIELEERKRRRRLRLPIL